MIIKTKSTEGSIVDPQQVSQEPKPTANELKNRLLTSLLEFTQDFYYLRTGRRFELSNPIGRESHYITICKELVKVIQGETKKLIINVPPRYGKALNIKTPILTQYGWTSAGEISVGDMIIGSSGWTKVTGVYPQGILSAKEILFSDNQSIICNDEHLWNVCDRYTSTWKTFKTSELEDSLFEADGRKHWRIPLINGNYGNRKPFVDPYLFGCWLGDGHSHYAAITSMDEEIIQAFRDGNYEMRLHTHQSGGKAKTYGILGLSKILRLHGLLKNKHIPDECYHWSKEDRLSLLQGLMDTDGTCGKNGQVSFTNINRSIINGCAYLVNSLGGTYKIYQRRCGTKTLNIRLPDNLKPFRLKRKQQYVSTGHRCEPRRFIENIIDVEPCEMVCFTVDAEDSLFAAGEGLILTHNTELLIHFVAWAMAQFPDSQFIYVSYGKDLATKQSETIRQIMQMQEYQGIFGIKIKEDSTAKANFKTDKNGVVYAAGSGGTLTGFGAGIQNCTRFGGAIIIDDIHKPDEVSSDVIRKSVNSWYDGTLQSRVNSPDTPIILIGQRLHEDDLPSNLIKTGEWKTIIIPALDSNNNALNPRMHDVPTLKKMQERMPYDFASQYQQTPQPPGGSLFKGEWFKYEREEPHILATFITADTAETDKTYNDASVFSFWGIYKITNHGIETDLYALHWLDCYEFRVEPKELEEEFFNFYGRCMRHRVKPQCIAIEKKSTGVTLGSILKSMRGLRVMQIERTKASGSKTTRFLEMQPYISQGFISLPVHGKHTEACIKHMEKITANNTHAFDDIADTVYDAIKLALIDKIITYKIGAYRETSDIVTSLARKLSKEVRLRISAYDSHSGTTH